MLEPAKLNVDADIAIDFASLPVSPIIADASPPTSPTCLPSLAADWFAEPSASKYSPHRISSNACPERNAFSALALSSLAFALSYKSDANTVAAYSTIFAPLEGADDDDELNCTLAIVSSGVVLTVVHPPSAPSNQPTKIINEPFAISFIAILLKFSQHIFNQQAT